MRFVIITGMSGAGKSSVLKMLEDYDYFCVDNLPIPLINKFAEFMVKNDVKTDQIALGIDIRSGQALEELDYVLEKLGDKGVNYEIIFLDCSTQVLVKRFKETRRTHPLTAEGRIDKGIEIERKKLAFLKSRAKYIIDTSRLLVRELKQEIDSIFVENKNYNNFLITVVSFGFKYGILADADLVFDVRFLPNPYYIPELKPITGMEPLVRDYVFSSGIAEQFVDKTYDMLKFLIPNYCIEGKNQLVIGIGCTGGKHRSVAITNAIAEKISDLEYSMKVEHRDIDNE